MLKSKTTFLKKPIIFLLGLFTLAFAFYACDTVAPAEEKDYSYFKLNLEKDQHFSKVLESAVNIVEFIVDPQTHINVDLNIDEFNEKLFAVKQKGIQSTVLSDLTNRPEVLFKLIEEKYNHQQKFIDNNPEFLKLTENEQKELIDHAVSFSMVNFKSMKGPCSDQYDSDISYCHNRQYAGAAACGLLSPTLLGALGCGVVVVVDAGFCHGQADADFELCLDATYTKQK